MHAAVVFVAFGRAPEIQFPIALEEAYAATAYVVNHADSLNLDGTRLAVVGDGAGGNMAAAIAIMSKQRRGPKIAFQVLFYPSTAANFEAEFIPRLARWPLADQTRHGVVLGCVSSTPRRPGGCPGDAAQRHH